MPPTGRRTPIACWNLHRREGIDYFKIDSMKTLTAAAAAQPARDVRSRAGAIRRTRRVRSRRDGGDPSRLFRTAGHRADLRGEPLHRFAPLLAAPDAAQPVEARARWSIRCACAWSCSTTRATRKNIRTIRSRPRSIKPDTLFAIAMMANPLGWFEVSNLPADYVASDAAAWWRRGSSSASGCTAA